jgi:hypothetical protein
MHIRSKLSASAVAVAACIAAMPAWSQPRRVVRIQSTPPGATVRVDTATAPPLGQTPLARASVTQGPHRLFFDLPGYVQGTLDVTVAARNTRPFALTLVQAGNIFVAANADGAQIFLDGTQVGVTPGRLNNVPPGGHVVEIRMEGRETVRETVNVTSGQLATVNATLRSTTAPTGSVRVVVSNPNGPVPADLQVMLDGAPLAGTPPANDAVVPGLHILQVAASGFRSTRREITVTAGQAQNIAIDLEAAAATSGSLRVIVPVAGAQVFLDGEALTVSNGRVDQANVSPGQHSLRVTAPGREPVRRDVTVAAGAPSVVELADGDLAVSAAHGRIAITVPARPEAEIFINSERVAQGRFARADAPNGDLTVLVRAPGFNDYTQQCTVSDTQACEMNVTLVPTPQAPQGPRPIDIARRRAGISTFGAAPLTRGDGAFDAIASFGGMPLELRATMGFVPNNAFPAFGNFAIDGGLAIRTRFDWYEFELRSRAGWRFADDLVAVGAEVRMYGALGFQKSRGFGLLLQGNLSFHFNLGSDAQTARGVEPVGGLGAITISLNAGLETNLDNPGGLNPTLTDSRGSYTLCNNRAVTATGAVDNSRSAEGACDIANTVRGFTGLVAELGLFRHLSFFAGATLYLPFPEEIQYSSASDPLPNSYLNPGSNVSRRPLTTSFWDASLPINLRLGLTYKF